MAKTGSRMCSWLFAPGDSARKIEKVIASEADRVILDLEDSVALAAKPEARRVVAEALEAAGEARARIWVRINPLGGGLAHDDLDAIMPARPGGIMLPKAEGGENLRTLDALLKPLEEEPGATLVHPLVTETAAAMLQPQFDDAGVTLSTTTAPATVLVQQPQLCSYHHEEREDWKTPRCGFAFDAVSEDQERWDRGRHEQEPESAAGPVRWPVTRKPPADVSHCCSGADCQKCRPRKRRPYESPQFGGAEPVGQEVEGRRAVGRRAWGRGYGSHVRTVGTGSDKVGWSRNAMYSSGRRVEASAKDRWRAAERDS